MAIKKVEGLIYFKLSKHPVSLTYGTFYRSAIIELDWKHN